MVSIPKASKEIRPHNHFTPSPGLYEWEKCLSDKKQGTRFGLSKRKIFKIIDGPSPAHYSIPRQYNTQGTYLGYKPDPYGIPILHPSPAEYQPEISMVMTSSPKYSIGRKRSLSPSQITDKLGPAYYELQQDVKLPNVKFTTQRRLFFDKIAEETPGPQKYRVELCNEDMSPKYSFTKDQRKLGEVETSQLPGPGQYKINDFYTNRKGAIFLKSKLENNGSVVKPGPGSYNLMGELVSPTKGIRFTRGKRSFDSSSHLVGPGPQQYTDVSFEKYKTKFPNPTIGTSKRTKEQRNQSPGPGAYQIRNEQFENYQHRIFILGKPKDYLDITDEKLSHPSPQKYDPLPLLKGPSSSIPKSPRDKQINPLEVPPGPGSYTLQQKQQFRFAPTFGPRTKILGQQNQNPGPGEYHIKGEIDTLVEKAKGNPQVKNHKKETEDDD